MPVECVLTSIYGTFCVTVVCMTDVRIEVYCLLFRLMKCGRGVASSFRSLLYC